KQVLENGTFLAHTGFHCSGWVGSDAARARRRGDRVYIFNTFDEPLAKPGTTQASGINGTDPIVGECHDASGKTQGFLLSGGLHPPRRSLHGHQWRRAFKANKPEECVPMSGKIAR